MQSHTHQTTPCPVCGPQTTEFVGECHDYPVVRCTTCQLMFVGECESIAHTEEFFRTEHVDAEATTELHYVSYRGESLKREASFVRSLAPEGGRLLDVGTASGFFLKEFRDQKNWQVEGVEPSAVSTRFAQERFGLNVQQGFLIDQEYHSDSFDVVTSLDAFNCHRTPNEDLAEIYRILKPGGIFAVEIPGQNYRMLTGSGPLCRLFFGLPLRLNAGVNFYFYTTQSLVTMAQRCGFEFESSIPESTPNCGNLLSRLGKRIYFGLTSTLYRLTNGRIHYAPKEFLVFRKPNSSKPSIKLSHAA